MLTAVAGASSRLPIHPAADGVQIEPSNVYLAVPDCHIILVDGRIKLGLGPRENMARPAIDPLFRSAAAAYGPRVVGVLLSGLLNDCCSGLAAIKRCGGLTVVQDPADAIADEMPLSAMAAVPVDLSISSTPMGDVLTDLVREPAGPVLPIPPEIRLEVDIAAGERVDTDIVGCFADPAALTCPSCGGSLSRVRDGNPLRYRCQVGHTMTAEILSKQQEHAVDEALRVALRVIEERAELVERMARGGRASGCRAVAEMYEERAGEYRRSAETIRRAVLLSMVRSETLENEGGQETLG
jgi:two-component system chemotaxis response regulator CheB